jgi:hypothetical protein
LGVRPEARRGFRADEDQVPGRDAVVVLGHDLLATECAASPDVIGKSIFLNGLPFTVVGVAPESFRGRMSGSTPACTSRWRWSPHWRANPSKGNSKRASSG